MNVLKNHFFKIAIRLKKSINIIKMSNTIFYFLFICFILITILIVIKFTQKSSSLDLEQYQRPSQTALHAAPHQHEQDHHIPQTALYTKPHAVLLTDIEYKTYNSFPFLTTTGYKTAKLPVNLRSWLTSVWQRNRADAIKEDPSSYGPYIVNSNKAEPSSYLLDLTSISATLKKKLETFILDELKKWSGVGNLVHTATYGIREYTDQALLKSHTDRPTTHVLSAIIHVGSINVRKPWALTVENRRMKPRSLYFDDTFDIILYESSSLVHGRPLPFQGERFANLFIHYAPADWDEQIKTIL